MKLHRYATTYFYPLPYLYYTIGKTYCWRCHFWSQTDIIVVKVVKLDRFEGTCTSS